MSWDYLPLLIVLCLGVLGNNSSVGIAAAVLLLLKLLGLTSWFEPLEQNGISIGVTILTIAILAPVAAGRITLANMAEVFKTTTGVIAIAVGIFVAWAGGRGAWFMKESPEVVTSLIIGTIAGVCFFNGIPVGPLIAGGLVYMLLSIAKLWS
ncbi:DUF441 domain-containing protein|uniref:UPF0756 membrane protein SAMN04488502_11311 n=1 Tax=Dendrosporobacter quercicolus TaxID=146817 RepID=A0A1G9Z264_9FIRM|nr:DUF441 domain-containing protein [Dendrosporobacter quercicolus]NSL48948.1 DUF441 domain-containing protein [Dendrosporobacter quercicolus DSM 1736]SDN15404.1 Uncharacterized membrane protein, DUF441 family [Dendrosporobacter quercicolus]